MKMVELVPLKVLLFISKISHQENCKRQPTMRSTLNEHDLINFISADSKVLTLIIGMMTFQDIQLP